MTQETHTPRITDKEIQEWFAAGVVMHEVIRLDYCNLFHYVFPTEQAATEYAAERGGQYIARKWSQESLDAFDWTYNHNGGAYGVTTHVFGTVKRKALKPWEV